MKWIILIGKENLFDTLKKMDFYESTSSYISQADVNRLCVNYTYEHIFFDEINENQPGWNDFEDDIKLIPYTNPSIIMMIYHCSDIVKKILCQDNFPQDIYIDNDFGIIVPLKKYIDMGMPME